ncbi:MAG TPA: hypothetical protein VGL87_02910, partial [Steroidobacteraceae bacterium]
MKSFVAQRAIGALLLAAVSSMAISAPAAPPGDAGSLSPSPSVPAAAPEIQPSEVFTYERFGKVSVYRPRGEPREVV